MDTTFIEVILGLIPAAPAYYAARYMFLRKKPVVYRTSPSKLTPIIAAYQQRQLEIEGRATPAALEASQKSNSQSEKQVESVLTTNYKKWASNRAEIPFVRQSVKVLGTISEMASSELTVEERYNLEVLSNQTEELLTNFFTTPESIRLMPAVQKALLEQLREIEVNVANVEVRGAETFIRNLQIGTEFIRTKFQS